MIPKIKYLIKLKEKFSKFEFLKGFFYFIFSVLIFCLILLLIILLSKLVGIIIHELGHYLIGKAYGCENLKINLAKFSLKDSHSNVSGWESCSFPLVIDKEGNRICNYQTNMASFGGLFSSLIVLISLIILINSFFKNKIKILYFEKKYLFLVILFLILLEINSSSGDLFKVRECLPNNKILDFFFKVSCCLPQAAFMPLLFLFLIMKAIDYIKNKPKLNNTSNQTFPK